MYLRWLIQMQVTHSRVLSSIFPAGGGFGGGFEAFTGTLPEVTISKLTPVCLD